MPVQRRSGAQKSFGLLTIFAITEFFLSLTQGLVVLPVISQSMRDGVKSESREK
jgi:hypothetical protein